MASGEAKVVTETITQAKKVTAEPVTMEALFPDLHKNSEASSQAKKTAEMAERLSENLAKMRYIDKMTYMPEKDEPEKMYNQVSDALTQFSPEETVEFAFLDSLDALLTTKSGHGGVKKFKYAFVGGLKSRRRGVDRLGIKEILSILKSALNYRPLSLDEDEEQKKGILQKLMFWRKD